MKVKKRVLKPWVKSTLLVLIVLLVGISIAQLILIETKKTTPIGNYTCRGGIVRVCSGTEDVANYLGV